MTKRIVTESINCNGLLLTTQPPIAADFQYGNRLMEDDSIIRNVQYFPGAVYKLIKKNGEIILDMVEGDLLDVLHLKKQDLIGLNVNHLKVQNENEKKRVLSLFQQAFEGKDISFEGVVNGVDYCSSLKPVLKGDNVKEVFGNAVNMSRKRKNAQIVEESEQRLRSLYFNFPEAIFSLDVSGKIKGMNPASEQLVGYQEKELLFLNYMDFIVPKDVHRVKKQFEIALEGNVVQYETSMITMEKEELYIQITNIPIYIHNEIKGLFGIVKNLTKERNAEGALTDSQEKYQLIAENTNDLICLLDSADKTVCYASPSHQWVLGCSAESFQGSSFFRDMDEASRTNLRKAFEEAVIKKEAIHYECRRMHAEGHWITFEDHAMPVFDSNNKISNFVVVSRDITAQKKSEKTLHDTLNKLEKLKMAIDEAALVSVTDKEGNILYVNKKFCEISQYDKDELLGNDHTFLRSDHHPPGFFEKLNETIKKGEIWRGELKNRAKDGSIFWVYTTIVPFLDENNEPYQFFYIRNDITEEKQTEELLRTTDKLSVIGELAAGVAHEIRNPLTSLKGFAQILRSRIRNKGDKEFVDIMLSELDRINHIVNEFMVLSKPQELQRENADMHELLKHVLAIVETQAIINNVTIRTDVPEKLPGVYCDKSQIKQVLLNLLKNAIEAMPGGGSILIRFNTVGRNLTIQITDTGKGIPEHQLKSIGKPFYTTKDKGNGLGLMICKKIIENHQGELHITSRENKGTIVKVSIPVVIS
ncbi:PAS domain-containing protein [Pseudalkalibacillus caeni]|uniref:PAS domain-containing protein n=1 Tax=Exobacillus caeni TaxID=2574798 RepID=UPI0014852439|nr:PAS domain-containing sensor histidine kinase [Pseudalkalibacillus caeni]